jgi:hypothetical protein
MSRHEFCVTIKVKTSSAPVWSFYADGTSRWRDRNASRYVANGIAVVARNRNQVYRMVTTRLMLQPIPIPSLRLIPAKNRYQGRRQPTAPNGLRSPCFTVVLRLMQRRASS